VRKEVRIGLALYMLADYLSAALAWFFLWVYRQQAAFSFTHFSSKDCFFTLLLIPGLWMLFHLFSGAYFNPYRKSRVNEIYRTLIVTFFGTVLLYFPFIQNDAPVQLTYYYKTFLVYYALQFCLTGLFRLIHLSRIKAHINRERFGYNTLIIGGNQQAIKLYQDICKNEVHLGYLFKGFVYADESGQNGMSNYLPKLGSIDQLEKIIDEHAIEEVVIAIDTSEHDRLQYILSQLSHRQVIIKITPDLYDIISGSVKTSNVFGAVLIEIYPELMPDWQRVFKRAIDVMASIVGLVLLSPLYLFSAIKVKLASPGAIFYKQERIGLYGKPFWIYKFRSMVMDAEKAGPALSSENDPRITAWGKVMRKWRIDELPQLYNILRGDMSLVGPRPERKYYIDIISKTNPHYKYLHKVKPGLSSWGMVKFGYAETPEQMIERMKYDLLYIKNCSLVLDVKIMFYTILVILQGRGK
jgi:exopolysaccharide biosynthesis polyprenyl glycosylphosphotransferase